MARGFKKGTNIRLYSFVGLVLRWDVLVVDGGE